MNGQGDGVPRRSASSGGNSFSFPVKAGTHTVSVIKETQIEASQAAYYYLTSLTFDGTILAAPAEKDMYIEFVGDSYSAGDGALGVYTPGQRWVAQDDSATHSFGWYVARELDADYSIIARGGIGLFDGQSTQEGWTRQHTMADIYSYTSGYNQGNGTYGFARQLDIVVIELGANDGIKTDDAYKTIGAWSQKMEAFIGQVRAKNPDAAIVCLHHQADKYYVSRQLAEKYDNVYAFYHAHNGNGSAALATQIEGHPSWEDHEDIAKALVNFFTYNDLLPQAAPAQTNDITYYVSANGSDSNDGKTLATAKMTLPAVLAQAKTDNTFADGDRVVVYTQGAVVGTTTQSFAGGEESQLRTASSKNVPVLITTYGYDAAADNKAELQVKFLPSAEGAASTYARNDFTFKDIAVKSYTSTQGFCIHNFYSAGCNVAFDNALLTTDGTITGTTKATVYGGTYPNGFAISGKTIEDVLAADRICVDAYGSTIALTSGQTATSGKTTVVEGEHVGPEWTEIQHCICGANAGQKHMGCDGTELSWTPWLDSTALPTEAGNYYLAEDVQMKDRWNPQSDSAITINLDLNGKTVYGPKNNRTMVLNDADVTLNITDSTPNHSGTITHHAEMTNSALQGTLIWVSRSAKLNLYRVTLDAEKASGTFGVALYVGDSGVAGTVNMYAATIKGGTSTYKDSSANGGGAISMRGGKRCVCGCRYQHRHR